GRQRRLFSLATGARYESSHAAPDDAVAFEQTGWVYFAGRSFQLNCDYRLKRVTSNRPSRVGKKQRSFVDSHFRRIQRCFTGWEMARDSPRISRHSLSASFAGPGGGGQAAAFAANWRFLLFTPRQRNCHFFQRQQKRDFLATRDLGTAPGSDKRDTHALHAGRASAVAG